MYDDKEYAKEISALQQECFFLTALGSGVLLFDVLSSAVAVTYPVCATIILVLILVMPFVLEPVITVIHVYDPEKDTFREVSIKEKLAAVCKVRRPVPLLWLCFVDVCFVVVTWYEVAVSRGVL